MGVMVLGVPGVSKAEGHVRRSVSRHGSRRGIGWRGQVCGAGTRILLRQRDVIEKWRNCAYGTVAWRVGRPSLALKTGLGTWLGDGKK